MKIEDVLINAAAAAYRLTRHLPKSHPLADQLQRAASSAALNASEGFSYSGKQELHFFKIAHGSAQEAKVAAKILAAAQLVDGAESEVVIRALDEGGRRLYGLIRRG